MSKPRFGLEAFKFGVNCRGVRGQRDWNPSSRATRTSTISRGTQAADGEDETIVEANKKKRVDVEGTKSGWFSSGERHPAGRERHARLSPLHETPRFRSARSGRPPRWRRARGVRRARAPASFAPPRARPASTRRTASSHPNPTEAAPSPSPPEHHPREAPSPCSPRASSSRRLGLDPTPTRTPTPATKRNSI